MAQDGGMPGWAPYVGGFAAAALVVAALWRWLGHRAVRWAVETEAGRDVRLEMATEALAAGQTTIGSLRDEVASLRRQQAGEITTLRRELNDRLDRQIAAFEELCAACKTRTGNPGPTAAELAALKAKAERAREANGRFARVREVREA